MPRPLLQELHRDPWRMLVACVLLNRTRGDQAGPVLERLLERYPDAAALAAARPVDVARRLRRLGLHRQRARKLIAMSAAWQTGERTLERLPGCGPYAADSWAIFQDGRRDLEPADRVLRAHLGLEPAPSAGGRPRRRRTRSDASTTNGRRSMSTTEQAEGPTPQQLADEAVKRAKGDVPLALHRAGKAVASTKWSLTGAGAEANPPKGDRKKALQQKLRSQQAVVKELRSRRDAADAE